MLQIKSNGSEAYSVNFKDGLLTINGENIAMDSIRISENKYHIIYHNKSVTIELVQSANGKKELDMVVNGVVQKAVITDEYDALLAKLGLDKLNQVKVNQIKAPMPGLVISIRVKEGDSVKKGDTILVLEAMKMENVIKAPVDTTILKINVTEKVAVEKNQVLVVLGE